MNDRWEKAQVSCWPDGINKVPKRKNLRGGRARKRIAKIRTKKYIEQDGLCFWCNGPFAEGPYWNCTADHVVELARGGTNCQTNIVAAHALCNLKRSQRKTPAHHEPGLRAISIRATILREEETMSTKFPADTTLHVTDKADVESCKVYIAKHGLTQDDVKIVVRGEDCLVVCKREVELRG